MNLKPDTSAASLEEQIFAFFEAKYVQQQDDRQQEMGLQYTTAETHDLAKETAAFITKIQTKPEGGEEGTEPRTVDGNSVPQIDLTNVLNGEVAPPWVDNANLLLSWGSQRMPPAELFYALSGALGYCAFSISTPRNEMKALRKAKDAVESAFTISAVENHFRFRKEQDAKKEDRKENEGE